MLHPRPAIRETPSSTCQIPPHPTALLSRAVWHRDLALSADTSHAPMWISHQIHRHICSSDFLSLVPSPCFNELPPGSS